MASKTAKTAQEVLMADFQALVSDTERLLEHTATLAGDQADEIAFIKAVIERSLPFSPFPPDIDQAARSLGVTICIRPGRHSEPGFSRMQGSRCV